MQATADTDKGYHPRRKASRHQATLQNPTLNGVGMELAVIKVARRHHQARPTTSENLR
ncbi:hypothetical protein [Limosilactobacillus fermentum]|uniref:hypothetical protein n=1 Tax=Limosilactobacillus fermentum TaxID=1613 RepID=UPI0022E3C8E5|nr:hypothetical protein [Limosilactobacillus fermentum]